MKKTEIISNLFEGSEIRSIWNSETLLCEENKTKD